VRSLGAAGVALLAALSLAEPSLAKKRKPKPRSKPFVTRVVQSELSAALQTPAGSTVFATVDCGKAGSVLSCGYQLSATAAQLVNVIVIAVASDDERRECTATIERTSDAGATAGAQIQTRAICLA
jgi:hypothetical protein